MVNMIHPNMVRVRGFSIAEFQFKRIKENELSFHYQCLAYIIIEI
jgi:hypothetical protein